jgi:hypothetical protein
VMRKKHKRKGHLQPSREIRLSTRIGPREVSYLAGPSADLWTQLKGAAGSDVARKTFGTAALCSAAALVLAGAAAAFMAIEARNPLHTKRRRVR